MHVRIRLEIDIYRVTYLSPIHSFYETHTDIGPLPVVLHAFATYLPHKKAMTTRTGTINQLTSSVQLAFSVLPSWRRSYLVEMTPNKDVLGLDR